MSWIDRARSGAILLATSMLALSFGAWGSWAIAAGLAVAGLMWLLRPPLGRAGFPSSGFLIFAVFAGYGAWVGLPAVGMLAALVLALAAWDLDRLAARLRSADFTHREATLVRSHLLWLSGACGLGLLVGGAATAVRLELGFWWTLLLALLAAGGLRQALISLRRLRD
jgi:hypothetical protein